MTDPGPVLRNRVLNAVSIAAPLAGTLVALALLPVLPPTAATFWIFAAFFAAETVGIGIGLHRYFTHRAFATSPPLRAALGVFGSWAMQGPIDRWVADHRRHHRFTDRPGDPHSPYWVDGEPASSRASGLWHAHLAWMLTGVVSDPALYASDTRRDPIARWCSAHYWPLCASSLLLPGLVGAALAGPSGALLAFLWAGCLRVSLLHQITWSVNSFGHMFGRRQPGAPGEGRDNLIFALLLFGEGLHGYHHRHPSAAYNHPLALDLNGQILWLLERLGVVWSLKPSPLPDRTPAHARGAEAATASRGRAA